MKAIATTLLALMATVAFAEVSAPEEAAPAPVPVVPTAIRLPVVAMSINSPGVSLGKQEAVALGMDLRALSADQLALAIGALPANQLAVALRPIPADKLALAIRALPTDKLAMVLGSLSPDEARQLMVTVFLADVDAWQKASQFLNPLPTARPARTYSATWVDAARAKIRARIAKEGYSPAVLQEAEAIIKKL